MPAAQSSSSGSVAGQVNQTSQATNTQGNFRQMVGEVLQHNPDAPVQLVQKWLQNSYRRIIDYRHWYGCMVRGEVLIPDVYTTGTVALTNNSATVVGTGTAWDNTFIGRSFRVGFTSTRYLIAGVTDATHMTLELPWSGPAYTAVSYQIFKNIVSLGGNVKHVVAMLNMRQGNPFKLWMPQETVNRRDVWRTQTGFSYMLLSHPPGSDGAPLWELYPAPTVQQGFPFIAVVQPPDISEAYPFPLTFIRSDVIVTGAIPDALLFRGKQNKYYDQASAAYYQKRFDQELEKLAINDDNHYMKDLVWEYSKYPLLNFGADYAQVHLDPGEY